MPKTHLIVRPVDKPFIKHTIRNQATRKIITNRKPVAIYFISIRLKLLTLNRHFYLTEFIKSNQNLLSLEFWFRNIYIRLLI